MTAQTVVLSWINGEVDPRSRHARAVARHRELEVAKDELDPKTDKAAIAAMDAEMDRIFDGLVLAVEADHRQIEAQKRRIAHRDESKLTMADRFAMACAGHPAAAKWGPAYCYVKGVRL